VWNLPHVSRSSRAGIVVSIAGTSARGSADPETVPFAFAALSCMRKELRDDQRVPIEFAS
jgi:hypothetical protein